MTNIKTIFFDLGNVLVKFDTAVLVEGLSRKGKFMPERFNDYFMDSKNMNLYMEGKLSSSRFYTRTKKLFNLDIKYREFYDLWNRIFYPYPEMDSIVENIKEKYPYIKLILVSNTNESHFDFIKKQFPIMKLMDEYVVSHEVGTLKPHPKIFKKALELSGALPKETVYTDDREDLIKSARTMGIKAFHFTGHTDLLSHLFKLSINI